MHSEKVFKPEHNLCISTGLPQIPPLPSFTFNSNLEKQETYQETTLPLPPIFQSAVLPKFNEYFASRKIWRNTLWWNIHLTPLYFLKDTQFSKCHRINVSLGHQSNDVFHSFGFNFLDNFYINYCEGRSSLCCEQCVLVSRVFSCFPLCIVSPLLHLFVSM